MNKRLVGYIILFNIIFAALVPTSLADSDETTWWDENWSFRDEIIIPIDTSSEHAKHQPIDIRINFSEPCWAKSVNEHSVRVIIHVDERAIELESQIYDLHFIDDTHIDYCSLVFLIPSDANGEEKYFVYYDDAEKSDPGYVDHVDLEESYYRYEPIPGISFETWHYRIKEGEYFVYGINYDGKVKGKTISQQIVKLKPGSDSVLPKYGDQVFCIDFRYWWKPEGQKFKAISTSEHFVRKQKFVDGNLMVKFGIVSTSDDEFLQTTVIYKYYYSPIDEKRIYYHAKHEVIDFPLKTGEDIDLSYGSFNCGIIKSSTIDDLNFGEIPPYLHFNGEENRVFSYDIPYPTGTKWDEIIGKEDNRDLGNPTWLSVDYGETGKAHGIMFGSNNVLKSGTDEYDGIEVQVHEGVEFQIPGLDARQAIVYTTRNTYEIDGGNDIYVPNDFVAEYDAEFFTTETGGYKKVEEEAKIFTELISFQPENSDNVTDRDGNDETYSLTVYGHLTPSLLLKMMSLNLLLQGSYVSAELYQDDTLISFGRLGRIPLTDDLKIDWKNISLFQKFKFESLKPDIYVVKFYLENTLLGDNRDFIGYYIVDLKSDTKKHIFCKPEGKVKVSVKDQNNNGIQDCEVYILKDGEVLSKNKTDSKGNVLLGAPCGLTNKYTLRVMYKGFLISEEQIRLGIATRLISLKKKYSFDVHDLTVTLRDSKGKIPDFDAVITLSSDKMSEKLALSADSEEQGVYKFYNLYPADYILSLGYNSFTIEEKINIPDSSSIHIKLHDLQADIIDDWGLAPEANLNIKVVSKDFVKDVTVYAEKISDGEYYFSNLYPGNYDFRIIYRTHKYETAIKIPDTENMSIVFSSLFNVTQTVYDARGNPLCNAKATMTRGGKQVSEITDDEGNVTFLIPPGTYINKIFVDGEQVSQEEVIVINDKNNFETVAHHEPISPLLTIVIVILIGIFIGYISLKKGNKIFFLKILAVLIVFIAIVSPLWSTYNSSDDQNIEQNTQIYLMPTKIVATVSSDNLTGGEITEIDDSFKKQYNILGFELTIEFQMTMDLLVILMVLGTIFVMSSLLFKKFSKKRLSYLMFIFALVIYIVSFVAFTLAVSEFANETVGSFFGSGKLDVSVPGETEYRVLSSSWGPNIGYYLYMFATIILIVISILRVKRFFKERKV